MKQKQRNYNKIIIEVTLWMFGAALAMIVVLSAASIAKSLATENAIHRAEAGR